jgi:hypothetical protein
MAWITEKHTTTMPNSDNAQLPVTARVLWGFKQVPSQRLQGDFNKHNVTCLQCLLHDNGWVNTLTKPSPLLGNACHNNDTLLQTVFSIRSVPRSYKQAREAEPGIASEWTVMAKRPWIVAEGELWDSCKPAAIRRGCEHRSRGLSTVGSCYWPTTGDDTAHWEDWNSMCYNELLIV